MESDTDTTFYEESSSLKWSTCGDSVDEKDQALFCKIGHLMCWKDDKDYFINEMISKIKCKEKPTTCFHIENEIVCGKKVSSTSLHKEMSEVQKAKYIELLQGTKNSLICIKCEYEKPCHENSTYNFFYCKPCSIVRCTVWNIEFENFNEIANPGENKAKLVEYMQVHQKCYYYKVMKDNWEKAKREGLERKCPHCEDSGTK